MICPNKRLLYFNIKKNISSLLQNGVFKNSLVKVKNTSYFSYLFLNQYNKFM